MKKCTKCFVEKELIEFSKSSKNKDGKRAQCKKCDKSYRLNLDNEFLKQYRSKYYLENKQKYKDCNKKYRLENAVIISENKKKNKDVNKIKERSRIYYLENKQVLNNKSKEYQQKNKQELNQKSRLKRIERKKTDEVYKLSCNIRRLIQLSFKSKGYKKDSKTFQILGCDSHYFKEYIESKFESWMSWNNKGLYNGDFNFGWDLDHIIPLKTAKTKEQVIKLNHYTNFQPLCGKTNREIKNGNY